MVPALSKDFLDIQAKYIVQIHSETCTWYDTNIQSDYLNAETILGEITSEELTLVNLSK